MFGRIIVYFLIPFVLFSCALAVHGVTEMPSGDEMYALLRSVNNLYETWNLEIPDVPLIPKLKPLDNPSGFAFVLQVLIYLVNIIVSIFNGLIKVINFLVDAINLIVGLLQFFLTFVYYCRDFIFSFRLG